MKQPKLSEEGERLLSRLEAELGDAEGTPESILAASNNLRAYMAAQESRIRKLEAEREWRPIETAPLDDWVLLYSPLYGVQKGQAENASESYTHWRSLPAPPQVNRARA